MKSKYIFIIAAVFVMGLSECSVSQSSSASSSSPQSSSAASTSSVELLTSWEWNGVIGTGQSLAVGGMAANVTATNQPYGNLKLSIGNETVPPWNPDNSNFSMTLLTEPIRPYGSGYPRAYPGNIWGETPHTAMANQISALVQASGGSNHITVHTVVGEAGQGYDAIKKGATDTGDTGRAYAASIFEARAIRILANKSGKKYGINAIVLTHGETDIGNSAYENDIYQLWSDYNADLKSITGQTNTIPMFVNQVHFGGSTIGTYLQWKAGLDHPGDIICTGPKYQYKYYKDGEHLSALGYDMLGEKLGEIYFLKIVQGQNWQPLQPTNVSRSGSNITVQFNVPVMPLQWDTNLPALHQSANTEWALGRGFEVYDTANTRYTISSVEISGSSNSIILTCSDALPASGLYVAYAMATDNTNINGHTFRSGQLCDSDPFIGSTTMNTQANYCVSFYLPVP